VLRLCALELPTGVEVPSDADAEVHGHSAVFAAVWWNVVMAKAAMKDCDFSDVDEKRVEVSDAWR
jgi:hypothetical protein